MRTVLTEIRRTRALTWYVHQQLRRRHREWKRASDRQLYCAAQRTQYSRQRVWPAEIGATPMLPFLVISELRTPSLTHTTWQSQGTQPFCPGLQICAAALGAYPNSKNEATTDTRDSLTDIRCSFRIGFLSACCLAASGLRRLPKYSIFKLLGIRRTMMRRGKQTRQSWSAWLTIRARRTSE